MRPIQFIVPYLFFGEEEVKKLIRIDLELTLEILRVSWG